MKKTAFILILVLVTAKTGVKAAEAYDQLPVPAQAVPFPEPAVPAAGKAAAVEGLTLVRSVPSKYWAKIDCYEDTSRPFSQENYLEKARHGDAEIVSGFGSKFPATSTFLLHYGKKWKANKGKVVVLAHGANHNATWAWAAPEMWLGNPETTGMLAALEEKGYRVFAVTFPHKHGSLFYEAQYLADAIEVARRATGAAKVTLIGHSAGGLAARVYVSNFRLNNAGWTPYRGDVEHLITLAAPHRGQDFAFRHPEFNFFFMNDDMLANGPMSWDKILAYGQWKDTFEFSIYSDNFPMQQQVLYDWSGKFPTGMTSPDYYTTMAGGQGFVSHSQGISSAIMKGGNFINSFKGYPVPADISVTVIAGKNNKIKNVPQTESDGPSDGLVFVESATHTADLVRPGRKEAIQKMVVDENHLSITYSPAMLKLVTGLVK